MRDGDTVDFCPDVVYIHGHILDICQNEPINQKRRNAQQRTDFSYVLKPRKDRRSFKRDDERGAQNLQ